MVLAWKIRADSNPHRIIDIVKNKRIYCSSIAALNDPSEGTFVADPDESAKNRSAVEERLDKVRAAKVKTRVCSLSLTLSTKSLWDKYGNAGAGAAVGIRLRDPDSSQNIRLVTYENFDKPVKVANQGIQETAREILSRKSKEWEDEEEIRVFSQNEFYHPSQPPRIIVFGHNSSQEFRFLLYSELHSYGCEFFAMEIDNGDLVKVSWKPKAPS